MTLGEPTEHRQQPSQELEDVLRQLPSLQEGWVRLTHFTQKHIAEALMHGASFSYERVGVLDSTTEVFNRDSMVDFAESVRTDQAGAFSRREFGDCVVIIDLEGNEHKLRYRVSAVHYTDVPNHNIVGYIQISTSLDGKRLYGFHVNPSFDPVMNTLTPIPPKVHAMKIPTNDEDFW